MNFIELDFAGAYIVEPVLLEDERGFFARTWCKKEFAEIGMNVDMVQCNISYSRQKGTLRGMHYQKAPYEEAKLVRCTQGAIYDVIIDLRWDSRTKMQWTSVELTAENRQMLYVPKGFAHGFQTLHDDTEVFYQMSQFYAPGYARGVRWNDHQFNIHWPDDSRTISIKDQNIEDFNPDCLKPAS